MDEIPEKVYEFLLREMKFLFKFLNDNEKSYAIMHHRKWCML